MSRWSIFRSITRTMSNAIGSAAIDSAALRSIEYGRLCLREGVAATNGLNAFKPVSLALFSFLGPLRNAMTPTQASWVGVMADREGFEPSVPFWGTHAFQASQFNHSCTSPVKLEFNNLLVQTSLLSDFYKNRFCYSKRMNTLQNFAAKNTKKY